MKWEVLLVVLIFLTTLVLASDNTGNEKIHDVIIIFEDGETINTGYSATRSGKSYQALSEVVPGKKIDHKFSTFNGISGKFTTSELEDIRKSKKVKVIEENHIYHSTLDFSVPLINATLFHNISFNGTKMNGTGVTVCILDTGIDDSHSALNDSLISNPLASRGFVGWDYVNNDDYPNDDNAGGHGTHVAGIVGSRNSTYMGVAPGVNIIPIKVLNSNGGGTEADIIAGIEWCANNATLFNITSISISIASTNYKNDTDCDGDFVAMGIVIDNATANNVSVVAAAGNAYDGKLGIANPACMANVTSVGRSDDDDTINLDSKLAAILDFLAPGTGIVSTQKNGGYVSKSGTSMSAPYVSATVALLQQQYHKFYANFNTVENIRVALNASGPKITDARLELDQDFTRIDVYGAYEAFFNSSPILGVIDPTPANLTAAITFDYTFNVSINDSNNISYCYLNFNLTHYEMTVTDTESNETNCNVSLNMSISVKGNYTYYVTGLDQYGALGNSEERIVEVLNTPPVINSTSTLENISSKENETITVNINVSDFNSDTLAFVWFLNATNISSAQNLTHWFNFSQAATYWNLSVNVSDGDNDTTYSWNVSVNSTNRFPTINDTLNYTINESEVFNITFSAFDIDDDNLTYSTNFTNITNSEANFSWATNHTNAGVYEILVNVTDKNFTTNATMFLTVLDVVRLNSNSSNITSTVALNIFVNGSLNETELADLNTVNLTDSLNNSLIKFDWNFSLGNISFNINYSSSGGTLLVQGLNLSTQNITKTVYINKSDHNFNYVCILDRAVDTMSAITTDCSRSNETRLSCPGTMGVYGCVEESGYFKVSGLNHTALRSITVPAEESPPSGGGTGTSGGGGDDDEVVVEVCKEDWICEGFKDCVDGKKTQRCFDGNNCGTTLQQPLLEKECVAEETVYQTQEPEPEPEPEPIPEPTVEKESRLKSFFTAIGNWFKREAPTENIAEESGFKTDNLKLESMGQRILLFSIGLLAFLLVMILIWKKHL